MKRSTRRRPADGNEHSTTRDFLVSLGADASPHAKGRSLLDHLLGTSAILHRWGQPAWLCDAGALHSVYGTSAYPHCLVPLSERSRIRDGVGVTAERLAYLFGVLSRRDLVEQARARGWSEAGLVVRHEQGAGCEELVATEVAGFLLLLMANLAEQACDAEGGPGPWVSHVSELGCVVAGGELPVPPLFDGCRYQVRDDEESEAITAYRSGLRIAASNPRAAAEAMARVSLWCRWLAEPLAWLAYFHIQRGETAQALPLALRAKELLFQWGTPWDKRIDLAGWEWFADFLVREGSGSDEVGPLPAPRPRDLQGFLRSVYERAWTRVDLSPDPDEGRAREGGSPLQRFHLYLDRFTDDNEDPRRRVYPGLRAKAWHSPADFPLAVDLEAAYPAIRREILALDDRGFAPEAEPIARVGNWDVLFFYERGRKNDAVRGQCPVTTGIIERHRTLRTLAGLIYVSRMRPGTHVERHNGPTNLRVRCHLGIDVPEGNCAIRVGGRTQRWETGRCLVFDDFLDHEAWNHTTGDRVVLIIDLWHPDLSPEEIAVLTGLHTYAAAHASSLQAYWQANEAARSLASAPEGVNRW